MNRKTPVIIILLLIVIVAVIGGATFFIEKKAPSKERMDGSVYYNMTDGSQVALMADGTLSETFGKKAEDRYYIDYDSVSSLINKKFYWDKNENKILYALPTEVVEISINTDSESGDCFLSGGQLYLSAELLAQYTDMTYEIYESPNRMVIRSGGETADMAEVLKDTAVRYRGGIKSDILTDAAAGSQVEVLDDSFENWVQVATADGYVGYIEKESIGETYALTNPQTGVEAEYTSISRDHKINMVWHQTTSQMANDAVESLLTNVTGVNVIAPTWFIINDTAGNLLDISSSTYVAMAHERGMEVWAVLNDFDGGIRSSEETLVVLSNTQTRRTIISNIMTSVMICGIDGINVDIEKVSEECAPHYLQFLRELSVSCRNNGIVLSVDNYVPKTYSAHYDRKEQGIVADYVVIMGYDEHFSGSDTAGSVASLPFVEDGIKRTLEEVPAEKIINGIPFFTRIWNTDSNGSVTSEACGMSAADEFIASRGMEVVWNAECGQNYAELESDTGFYQIWLEDEQSVAEKMKLIQSYDLAGVAAWKLGFEHAGIWSVISQYLQ